MMSTTNTLPRTMSPLPRSSLLDTPLVALMAREALVSLLMTTAAPSMLPSYTLGASPSKKNTTKPLCDSVGISIRSAATQWRYSCKNSVYSMMKWVSKHPADSSKKAVSSRGFAASLPTSPIPSTGLAVIQGSHHHCRATTMVSSSSGGWVTTLCS